MMDTRCSCTGTCTISPVAELQAVVWAHPTSRRAALAALTAGLRAYAVTPHRTFRLTAQTLGHRYPAATYRIEHRCADDPPPVAAPPHTAHRLPERPPY